MATVAVKLHKYAIRGWDRGTSVPLFFVIGFVFIGSSIAYFQYSSVPRDPMQYTEEV